MDDVAVPEHVLLALAGEGADAAVEAVVLLVDRPSLDAARDLVPLLLPLLLVCNLQYGWYCCFKWKKICLITWMFASFLR